MEFVIGNRPNQVRQIASPACAIVNRRYQLAVTIHTILRSPCHDNRGAGITKNKVLVFILTTRTPYGGVRQLPKGRWPVKAYGLAG